MFGASSIGSVSLGSPVGRFIGVIATRATVLFAPGQSSTPLTAMADEVILRGK